MNWYKLAKQQEQEFKWKRFLGGFSLGTIIALSAWFGGSMIDLRVKFNIDPIAVEQKAYEIEQGSNDVEQIIPQQNTSFINPELKNMIARHEGKRNKVYNDSLGIPTIGIGFNLNRNDAREKIESLGLSYDDIIDGKVILNDQQIDTLFEYTLEEAQQTASNFVNNFNNLPSSVQSVLIDMAFNLGPNRLAQFKNFKQALENNNFELAAKEMIDSRWYNQVGNRSKELVNIMRNN